MPTPHWSCVMANNKNQHFIPQFYLRKFSKDGRSIALLNLASGRVIPEASIKGQCSKPYLYGKDEDLEAAIQQLEQAGAGAISRILESEQPPAHDSKDGVALLTYAAFQYGRTPTAGEEMDAIATEMVRRILAAPGVVDDPEMAKQIKNISVRHHDPILNAVKMAMDVGPCLLDLPAKLVVNESAVEFVTSDVAVVFHNQWCEEAKGVGTRGFASGGLQIFIPLSPRRLLVFYDPKIYKVGKPNRNVLRFDAAADAVAVNALQREAAHANLYFSGDKDTEASLLAMKGERKPRHVQVKSHKAKEVGGENELIHLFHESGTAKLQVPWCSVRRAARRVKLQDRLRSWRPDALRMDEFLRGPRRSRYGPPPDKPRTFVVVPDGDEGSSSGE